MITWIKNEFKLGKTLLSYGIFRVTGFGFSFLVPFILAIEFSPKLFGIYSLGMMIVYFFNSTLILSSSTPFIVIGNEELKKNQRISKAITSRLVLVILLLLFFPFILLCFHKPLIAFTGLSNRQIYFLVFALTGKCLETFFSSLFLIFNKRIQHSIYHLIITAVYAIYLILLYFFFTISIENVFIMFLFSPIIAFSILAPYLDYSKIFPLKFDMATSKEFVHYTKWMILGGTALYFFNWGDNLILRKFVSIEKIGVYNLGYQFFKGTIMIISIINIYFFPFISQHIENKEKIRTYMVRKRFTLFCAGIIILGCFYIIIPLFVSILYNVHYKDSILVFRILLFGSVCALYFSFYIPIFNSLKKFKYIQIVTVVSVVFNLLLDYILIGRIGFVGAAIATSSSYFLMAVLHEIYFRIYCKPLVM